MKKITECQNTAFISLSIRYRGLHSTRTSDKNEENGFLILTDKLTSLSPATDF